VPGKDRAIVLDMRKSAVSKYLSMIAKRGGEARARTLTAEQRKAIATKASEAAAVARKRKAKERRAKVAEKIPPEQRRQGAQKTAKVRRSKDKKKPEELGESTIQSEPTGTSEEDTRILDLLTRVVHSARRRNMAPPFEVHVRGADDDPICHLFCEEDGEGLPWLRDLAFSNTKLTARFPMTATLTDSRGEALKMTGPWITAA